VLLATIGVVDYASGREIGLSIFYIFPILLAVSTSGLVVGLAVGTLAALVWFLADALLAKEVEWFFYWNGVIRLAFFWLVGALYWRLSLALARERTLARQDPLSGIPNSRAFFEMANAVLEQCRIGRRPIAVAYIDCE